MVRSPHNGPIGPAAGAAKSRRQPHGPTTAARGALMYRSLAVSLLLAGACTAWGQEKPTVIPAPALGGARITSSSEKADLAGGCYWGTQGIFEHVKGIKSV